MANLGDNINPTDAILSRLSQPRRPDEMPSDMRCPAGHRARRHIIRLTATIAGEQQQLVHSPGGAPIEIPVWLCIDCLVGYRYPECTLIPGEEGHA